jgi:hypothetical protein
MAYKAVRQSLSGIRLVRLRPEAVAPWRPPPSCAWRSYERPSTRKADLPFGEPDRWLAISAYVLLVFPGAPLWHSVGA